MNLHRIRWAVRLTLALGVAASVTANILHARHNPISQGIASWPPLALLLTIELISRVPAVRRSMVVLRVFATSVISGIAAWVSYWHMAGVAARYGETGTSPYLLPISVDGLIVVASISLVELSAKMRDVDNHIRQVSEMVPELGQTIKPSSSRGEIGYPQGRDPLPAVGLAAVSVERVIEDSPPTGPGRDIDVPTNSIHDNGKPIHAEPKPIQNRGGDDLKAKALEWVQAYTGEKTLTGQMVGAEFGRSQTWGRGILREARS